MARAGSRTREKKDKWKALLQETEKQAENMLNHVAALEAEQARLKRRADMLSVVTEGLGVVVHFKMLLQRQQYDNNAPEQQLQIMEQQIQQLLEQLGLACSPVSFLQPGTPAAVHGPAPHYSTKLLISLFQPAWVSKVLSMPEESIVARLRELVGKVAIMLCRTRPDTGAAAADINNNISAAVAAGGPGARESSVFWQTFQQQQTLDEGAAAGLSAGAERGEEMPPQLEYAALMLTLMLWDEPRFWSVMGTNLETSEKDYVFPAEGWADVAIKAGFIEEQVALLTCMHSQFDSGVKMLFQSIGDAAKDGLAAAVLQEQQQLMQQLPQSQQALLHEQAALLQKQSKDLLQWQLLGLQVGILTINTLTLRQFGLLQVLCYPGSPRIDLIMRAYKTLQQQPAAGQPTSAKQRPKQQQAKGSPAKMRC